MVVAAVNRKRVGQKDRQNNQIFYSFF